MRSSPPARKLLSWALPIAGFAASSLGRTGLTYAASALLHMVVLGGLACLLPSGDSDPSFSMGRGDGGLGSEYAPIGSAGGAPLTAVFHFELPPITAVAEAAAPIEAEVPPEPVFATSTEPDDATGAEEARAPTPVAMALPVRREPDGPDVAAPVVKLEGNTPLPETIAAQIERVPDTTEVQREPD